MKKMEMKMMEMTWSLIRLSPKETIRYPETLNFSDL